MENDTLQGHGHTDTIIADVPCENECRWAALSHACGLLNHVFVVPLFGLFGALAIWVAKKYDNAFIEEQAREALNFQITMLICRVLVVFLMLTGFAVLRLMAAMQVSHMEEIKPIPLIVGFGLLFALMLYEIINCIKAAWKCSDCMHYAYPHTIRIVK